MTTLSTLTAGDTATIEQIGDLPPAYRESLFAMGVMPGVAVKLVRRAPLGDPIQVEIYNTQLSIRAADAIHILVCKDEQ